MGIGWSSKYHVIRTKTTSKCAHPRRVMIVRFFTSPWKKGRILRMVPNRKKKEKDERRKNDTMIKTTSYRHKHKHKHIATRSFSRP